MDRDLILALMGAVLGTTLISAYYFGGSSASDAAAREAEATEAATFDPKDVRYPFQQEERRERERAKRVKHAPPPPPDTGNDYAEDSSGDSEIEQPPAEEPSIE